ncbi:hypothetical protein DKX38_024230 [Salix brachista]|uniref:Glucose-induced degradation protein 4 homolog n=1 Tax=Salix brachista TaxID=2182728 RepID=A0A5N5JKT1_9ROSI|nr:hypothetical protein DKX38_024230 [Salix brachista]
MDSVKCYLVLFFQVNDGLVNIQNVLAVMFTLCSYDVCQVVTFWEGEIVDGKNYTFYTGKWEALSEDDIRHWTKFPSFQPFLEQVKVDGGKSLDLINYPYIFMRWKEQYFVNVGTDCGLTIAGFYYVCFSCTDGSINGFYYDPNSSPFQKLELKSTNEGRSGFSFSFYELQ